MAGSKSGSAPRLISLNDLLKSKLKVEEAPLIFLTDKQWAAWRKKVKPSTEKEFNSSTSALVVELRPIKALGGCIVHIRSTKPKLKPAIIPSLSTKSKLVVVAVDLNKFEPIRPNPAPQFLCGFAFEISGSGTSCYGKCKDIIVVDPRTGSKDVIRKVCVGESVLLEEAVYGLRCTCRILAG